MNNIEKNLKNLEKVAKLYQINFPKREYCKGITYKFLVEKGFFTIGNGVWNYFDINFPFHIEFSHWKHLNSIRIYDANNSGKFFEFKYRENKWINRFLLKIDELIFNFKQNQLELYFD